MARSNQSASACLGLSRKGEAVELEYRLSAVAYAEYPNCCEGLWFLVKMELRRIRLCDDEGEPSWFCWRKNPNFHFRMAKRRDPRMMMKPTARY